MAPDVDVDVCQKCKGSFVVTNKYVKCFSCRNKFHNVCVSLKDMWLKALMDCENIVWLCDQCKHSFFSETLSLKKEIDSLKKEKSLTEAMLTEVQYSSELQKTMIKVYEEQIATLKSDKSVKSYNEVVKTPGTNIGKVTKILLITPLYLSDVTKSVIPVALNICVNKTRKIKNGVAIHCKDDKSLEALKTRLSSSLGQEYSFDKQQKLNPRMMLYDVRFEGLNSPNEIVKSIISLNELAEEHKADIRYITQLKRSNTTDIVLEVSPQLRKRFLRRRFLFIGWKASNVSDYVRVKNCYKCCGYGHFSKDCKSELHCPKCAGSHKLKDCTAETVQRINCLNYNRQHNRNIPTDHEATFSSCSVHKNYVENLKHNINYD
nr:unnamed protein product [Callosobruchus analis]